MRLTCGTSNFSNIKCPRTSSTSSRRSRDPSSSYSRDPALDPLRFVLRQIYSGPFLEYVVRNPLVDMDSRVRGIDNEYFRMSTDRLVRGLTVFQ